MRIIIPMIVGGIIGYITNWLAIKMLFRPHREVKVLGIKLPFTPGLIPKERERMAESIGLSVGENLLSPDVITNALLRPDINESINTWIKENIFKLRENHNPINTVLMVQGIEKYEELVDYLNKKVMSFIFSKLDSENFKGNLLNFAEDILYNQYGSEIKDFAYGQINILLVKFLNSSKLENEVELGIKSIIGNVKKDNRTLYEAIPESIISSINNYIDEEQDVIATTIIDIIKNPEIQDKLKSSLADLVDQNLSKVITMFVTPDQISDKIFIALEKYIDGPEVNETIIYIVKNSIHKFLSNKVSEISEDLLNVVSSGESNVFSDIIMDYIGNEENQNKLGDLLIEKLESEDLSVKSKLMKFLSQGLEKIVNLKEFREILQGVVKDTLENILNQPISSIFIDLE